MSRNEDQHIYEFLAFVFKYFGILCFMEEMGISNSNLSLMHPSPPHLFRRQVFKVKKIGKSILCSGNLMEYQIYRCHEKPSLKRFRTP